MTKNRKFWPFSSFYPILMAFRVLKIWPFWHFFPFFDLDSSRKILSKIKLTLVYRPLPKKMTRIWPFFPFYPILMDPLNLAILALFSIFFAVIRYLKSTFLLLFGKIGEGGCGNFGKSSENIKKLTHKSHQYRVKWK